MKALHMITFLLMVVGGLNWGLIGLGWLFGNADWNVVHMILGSNMQLEAVAYALVGLSTLWILVKHPKECKMCMGM